MPATQKLIQPNNSTKVTSISTNSRIDYLMRFSKQAVLVIDPLFDNYSLIGSEFLGALPSDHNAAFISVSAKLNDIQIRCRLIEQLFAEVLFDPEEPLAATVLKLALDKNQVISIVIENAHYLSLQLMHEFCQLSELAAKANRSVNVLLLGEEKSGKLVVENKTVFENKLSLISASTGQLIPFTDKMFEPSGRISGLSPIKITAISLVAIITITLAMLINFYQTESLTQSSSNNYALDTEAEVTSGIIKVDKLVSPSIAVPNEEQASVKDIYQILVMSNEGNSIVSEPVIAAPIDVASLLTEEQAITLLTPKSEPVQKKKLITDSSLPNADYYSAITSGFVVQIIGFSKLDSYHSFIKDNSDLDFVGYQRVLKDQTLIVVTTKAYPLKSDAVEALSLLPEQLRLKGLWIKSVEAIKTEIEEYQNSLYPITINL